MSVADKLSELGIVIPQVSKPVAAYVPALRDGDLVYTSGQLPFVDGELIHPGVVGDAVSVDEAYAAARQCAINALAAIESVVGDLDKVKQVLKVVGYVASAPGFGQQPQVINGASELFGDVFGERGQHARSAVGVAALPLGTSVELDVTVRV